MGTFSRRAAFGSRRIAANRQRPNADAGLLEYHDAPLLERVLQGFQVRQQQRYLPLRPPLSTPPKQDYRRVCLFPKRENRPEIGIGRYDHTIFTGRAIEDGRVLSGCELVVSNVDRIMTRSAKRLRKSGGEWRINQKLQRAELTGSSRSRTASAA